MTCSLKPQFRFSRCEKGKGHHVLRFFHNVCYDKFRNECTDFYWRFIGGSAWRACSQGQARRSVRCMRILQRPYLQGFTLSR